MGRIKQVEALFKSLQFRWDSGEPKYIQLGNALAKAIEYGKFDAKTALPSVAELVQTFNLSRDTVGRTYNYLLKTGMVRSVSGKGHYVNVAELEKGKKVCLVLDDLSSLKRDLYDALSESLGEDVSLEIFVYNNSASSFRKIMKRVNGSYGYYLVIPCHSDFYSDALGVLKSFASNELILLDRKLSGSIGSAGCVYKSFEEDLNLELDRALPKLRKYSAIKMIGATYDGFSNEIQNCLTSFCRKHDLKTEELLFLEDEDLTPGSLFICHTESELTDLIERSIRLSLSIGKDIGIISVYESPLKRFIGNGISTLAVDYKAMGAIAARMIQAGRLDSVKVPLKMIERGSV